MKRNRFYKLTFSEIRDALIGYQNNLEIDDADFIRGNQLPELSSDKTIFVQGNILTDSIFYPLSPYYIVSPNVKIALNEASISDVQFLSVKVVHRNGIEIPGYSIMNILEVIPALDYEHTQWVTDERENVEYPALNIWVAALRLKKEQVRDIFRLKEATSQVFVSEKFKKALTINHADLGFDFIEVHTVIE